MVLLVPAGLSRHPTSMVGVLLVDDSPQLLKSLHHLVTSLPGFGVVGMAMSGADARAMKASAAPPRIVVVTEYTDEQSRTAAARAGADCFRSKADLPSGLVVTLNALFPSQAAR